MRPVRVRLAGRRDRARRPRRLFVSIKIANIGVAGGIVGRVAPGDPFEGGYGGGDVTIPGYMISQAVSNRLKSGLPEIGAPGASVSAIAGTDTGPFGGTSDAAPTRCSM